MQRRRRRPEQALAQPRVHDVRRRLGADVIAHLIHDHESGQSTAALMQNYQLGKGTVLSLLAEHGVKMRGQGIPEDQLGEAINLYKSGWSVMRVGKHFGCSAETVRQTLLAAGVPPRRQWEWGPL